MVFSLSDIVFLRRWLLYYAVRTSVMGDSETCMLVKYAHWIISLVRLLCIVRFRRESVVLPGRFVI